MANRGTGWAQAVADGINGYLKGYMAKRDMDQQDADRAYQDEQRTNARNDRAKADALDASLRAAAAPVGVTEGAGGMTAPASADNRDIGQPGEPGQAAGGLTPGVRVGDRSFSDPGAASAYAASQNTPEAIRGRQVAALTAAGKPLEAQQLDTAGTQGQLAKVHLEKSQQEFIDKQFDKRLSAIQTPEDLAATLNGSQLVGGGKVTVLKSPDGKSFQLARTAEDGTVTPMGPEMGTDARSIQKQAAQFSQSMDYSQKVTFLQHQDTLDETKRHNKATEGHAGAQLAESSRHNRAIEGNAAATLGLAREKYNSDLKNDPTHNLPGAVKLRATSLEKQITGLEAAINKALGEPGADPQSPGLRELAVRKAKLEGQRNELLKPFLGETGGNADYMGYGAGKPTPPAPRGSIAAAPAGTVVNTASGWRAADAPPAGGMAANAGVTPPAGNPAPGAASTPQPGMAATAGADPLLAALGGTSGNASLNAVVARSAQPIRDAAATLKTAQAQVTAAARSGDQGATAQAMQAADAANQQFNALLEQMEPGMAARVKQAVGL